MDRDERALALGDVAAEILLGRLLGAGQVQDVVLDLEREAGGHPEGAQSGDLLLRTAAYDRAHGERHPAGVERGLVVRHHEVVVDAEVEAGVACPTDVERLTLDRARRHVDELAQHAQLGLVVQPGVANDGAGDE